MSDNSIYKHKPETFFESPQLDIAIAIRQNDIDQIDLLYNENINLNQLGENGVTLLYWACAHHKVEPVEKLLQLGADPNILIDDGESKLHLVAMAAVGMYEESFELLLKYGGNPNGEIDGTPALFLTINARRFDKFDLLLEKGASVNAIDKKTDLSIVHYCSVINLFDKVVLLLEKGADFERKDKVGDSVALQVQEKRGQLDEEGEKWRFKAESFLKDKGVKFPVPLPEKFE